MSCNTTTAHDHHYQACIAHAKSCNGLWAGRGSCATEQRPMHWATPVLSLFSLHPLFSQYVLAAETTSKANVQQGEE